MPEDCHPSGSHGERGKEYGDHPCCPRNIVQAWQGQESYRCAQNNRSLATDVLVKGLFMRGEKETYHDAGACTDDEHRAWATQETRFFIRGAGPS